MELINIQHDVCLRFESIEPGFYDVYNAKGHLIYYWMGEERLGEVRAAVEAGNLTLAERLSNRKTIIMINLDDLKKGT